MHAHFSNIDYIENALSSYDVELMHFVDPGLIYRVTSDESFTMEDAQNKVKEQIEWMAQCNVDAILITCTNYIAVLQEEKLSISIPIIKIDEPYFEYICNIQQPQTIVFSNPATVNGTMERLNQFAEEHQKLIDIEVMVINAFELIMKGQKQEYNQSIINFLKQLLKEGRKISVAQLSMVDASRQVEAMTSQSIINPLDPLVSAIAGQLKIERHQ